MVMKLRTMSPQWFSEDPHKTAKCVNFPATAEYDPWFGELDDSDIDDTADIDDTEEAKAICLGTFDNRPCPLRESCLEFALVNNERYGVWGGMSVDERAKLRKERRTWQQSEVAGAPS